LEQFSKSIEHTEELKISRPPNTSAEKSQQLPHSAMLMVQNLELNQNMKFCALSAN
jgi:hypothetical protein